MESKIVKADFKKLNAFVECLRSGHIVKVGIMGQKSMNRKDKDGKQSTMTNADVGFIHEFGQPPHIPMRSFLRMPLFMKSDRILKEVAQDAMVKKLGSGDMIQVLKDLGVACVRAILDAFDTRGFGHWKANAPLTVKRKGSSQPLIDLGFLRKSIDYEVVKA